MEVTLGGLDGDDWTPLTVETIEGAILHGWWRSYGPFLLTMAAESPLAAPLSIEEPPALASGQPVHSWLSGLQ